MPKAATTAKPRQAQMNTRIDARLKEAGDAVLARLGYTPSQAVRGLWMFAVAHQDDAATIRQVIEPHTAQALSDEAAGRIAATEKLRALYQQTAGELHIPQGTNDALPTWSDLRGAWYEERLDQEE